MVVLPDVVVLGLLELVFGGHLPVGVLAEYLGPDLVLHEQVLHSFSLVRYPQNFQICSYDMDAWS